MAVLLQQAANLSQDHLRAGVIEVYAQNSAVAQRLDFLNIMGNAYAYNVEGALPGVGFRGVNQAFPESAGIVNPETETLKLAGGDLDVDKHIIRTRGIGVRRVHEAMKVKALALYFSKIFIKGDSSTDPREFDGLNRRIVGSQLVSAGTNGAALTQNKLDDLLEIVPGANAILCGYGGKSLMTQLLRGDPQVSTATDQFGNQVMTYAGREILDLGRDNEYNYILDFNEDDGEGNLDTTSIYAARWGAAESETDLFGIQAGAMDVTDLGEISEKPVYRSRLEWDISIAATAPDCVARLQHINNAIA